MDDCVVILVRLLQRNLAGRKGQQNAQIVVYVWSRTNGSQNMTMVSPDDFTQVVQRMPKGAC